ncbi:MAG: glyceraldehyde-3-phosphate dehydrogenase [Gammaproteobacteria bacterium]|nr:glyceraldehyde-3-phosphate dehydrogenase [Gammaproteobacteria bacterium]
MSETRVGIMGFGRVAREFYRLAAAAQDIEVVVVADIAKAGVLHYLLSRTGADYGLDGNWIVHGNSRTRMLRISDPHEVPWDAFDVDIVIEATGKYRSRALLQEHLANGAPRVLLSSLPDEPVDRIVLWGVNEGEASADDRIVSGGSQTTSAFALAVQTLDEAFGLEHASMTTIHAFTSDQPAQDYPAEDARRSRSAAKNIIPNSSDTPRWTELVLPHLAGKLAGYALNVPVQKGSLLDVSAVLADANFTPESVNEAFAEVASRKPDVVGMTNEPIVSSDVIEETRSIVVDGLATLRVEPQLAKVLCWYDARGHAARLLDLVRLYHSLPAGSTGGDTP